MMMMMIVLLMMMMMMRLWFSWNCPGREGSSVFCSPRYVAGYGSTRPRASPGNGATGAASSSCPIPPADTGTSGSGTRDISTRPDPQLQAGPSILGTCLHLRRDFQSPLLLWKPLPSARATRTRRQRWLNLPGGGAVPMILFPDSRTRSAAATDKLEPNLGST